MKKIKSILLIGSILVGFAVSSCAGLSTIEDKPTSSDYGPHYSLQEYQTQIFEALWKIIQDNYIYYDSAGVDWDSIHSDYLERIKSGLSPAELNALFDQLTTELPKGSLVYQSRDERIESDTADLSTYGGIGAFVGFEEQDIPHIVVLDVMPKSPAEKAGLKAHDSILKIDGKPIRLEEGLNAVERVRGPEGSSVDLSVKSPGQAEREVKVTRAAVSTGSQLKSAEITDTDYGYLLFPPVAYEKMMDDVLQSLRDFTSNRKLKGLILDLRIANSTGGWPLEQLLALFGDGNPGVFYNREQSQQIVITGQNILGSQSVPLVIIVGENTSGSPEILAASLQAIKRVTVIGGATQGSVEGESTFYLPDGSRIFVESSSIRLLNGEEIGMNGIKPDVLIETGWDEIQQNNDPLIEESVKILEAVK